jgi:single-strand DNA-binding protein
MGHVGGLPDARTTAKGTSLLKLSVATNRNIKLGDNEWREETDWHNVVLFGPLAERQGERIRKGDLVLVEGRMHQSKWTNEKGEPRSKVEVIGQLVRVLGRLARRDGSMDPLFDEDPQVAAGAPPALAVPQIHSSIAADADIHL